jgi:hypothetical protein
VEQFLDQRFSRLLVFPLDGFDLINQVPLNFVKVRHGSSFWTASNGMVGFVESDDFVFAAKFLLGVTDWWRVLPLPAVPAINGLFQMAASRAFRVVRSASG